MEALKSAVSFIMSSFHAQKCGIDPRHFPQVIWLWLISMVVADQTESTIRGTVCHNFSDSSAPNLLQPCADSYGLILVATLSSITSLIWVIAICPILWRTAFPRTNPTDKFVREVESDAGTLLRQQMSERLRRMRFNV